MSEPSRVSGSRGRAATRRLAAIAGATGARLHQLRCERRSTARLDRIGAGGGPIVVGPWVSEVGFELLYWVPLLRRVLAAAEIDPQRVTVVSRGGAHAWYRDFCAQHVEIFDLLRPSEFRELNRRRARDAGGQKQLVLSEMEAEILRRAGDALDPHAALVHPAVMYDAFRYYWAGRSTAGDVLEHLSFAPLQTPPHGVLHDLPERYVALKAYHSASFPPTPANRRFVVELVRRLSAETAVVLLTPGHAIDEHADVAVEAAGRVIAARDLFEVRDNLAAQTAIVARANALVSSYGGFSYLGPFVGVPSYSFSSVRNYNASHLDIASRAAQRLGTSFVTFDSSDPETLDELLAAATPGPGR